MSACPQDGMGEDAKAQQAHRLTPEEIGVARPGESAIRVATRNPGGGQSQAGAAR